MKTLDELVCYCNEIEPAGTLLLSGEWGCGKTYLIEHDFKDAVEDIAVVVRISLFGIASLEGVHMAVKSAWFNEYCNYKGLNGINRRLKTIKDFTSKIGGLPEWLKGAASTDISALINISNRLSDKKVILIFDDLERCQVNFVDVLGIINEYCENQKFHTIIVANQDKIDTQLDTITITAELNYDVESNKHTDLEKINSVSINLPSRKSQETIKFSEIKEKIVQRTVPYIPDYSSIIHNVLVNTKYQDETYELFILNNEKEIVELFAPDRDEILQEKQASRPHNIRSLKCAICDFYRVFQILSNNDIPNIEKWLYSFISYMIAYKANVITEESYGTLFSESDVKKMYPAFNESFVVNSIKKWILHGIWDSKKMQNEIDCIKLRNKVQTPYDILRLNRIIDIDEEYVTAGFGELLENAYNGILTLDEYVLFIENNVWARKCDYSFPIEIDWNRIKSGINKRINIIVSDTSDDQLLFRKIGKNSKEYFKPAEWESYQIISKFVYENGYMFMKNRKLFIDCMKNDPYSAYTIIQNKRFNNFDEEMANVTFDAFLKVSNYEKAFQAQSFKHIWETNIQISDYEYENGIEGFYKLKGLLDNQLGIYKEGNKPIAATHTQRFIDSVSEIINIVEKHILDLLNNSTDNTEE